jgi:hypothetical protein
MGLATGGMALILLGVLPFLPASNAWLIGLVGIGLGGAAYVGLAHLLGLDEFTVVLRRLRRR